VLLLSFVMESMKRFTYNFLNMHALTYMHARMHGYKM